MKIQKGDKNGYRRFIVQNLGMITGFVILALIVVFEQDIENLFV